MERGKHLPTDAKERKEYPLWSGLFMYFPDALVEVAHLSWVGNNQHNPGQPMHWAREKSIDQEDTLLRHMLEAGEEDKDGVLHSVKVAWRALAKAQLEIEARRELNKKSPHEGFRPGGMIPMTDSEMKAYINAGMSQQYSFDLRPMRNEDDSFAV